MLLLVVEVQLSVLLVLQSGCLISLEELRCGQESAHQACFDHSL